MREELKQSCRKNRAHQVSILMPSFQNRKRKGGFFFWPVLILLSMGRGVANSGPGSRLFQNQKKNLHP